ncbi:MAG: Serine/threonine-protein kinase PknD, partial [Chlamydiae bacterium]|nr:Serine/threonine-protein kinase PknD [Chlamydiota bacterium]
MGPMQKIGRYSFIRSLAKGGMGEVILAHDPTCDREIALKRIRPDLKEHGVIKERFLREAKITASLTHPGIITIYTIHQEEDELYYTMPYVAGQTFKELLRSSPSPTIASLLPIFLSTCQTIAYTHSKNILHRDLKPENILVGKFGEVILLDWGLALHAKDAQPEEALPELKENEKELTRPGKIAGTLAFLAPERILGAPATIQTDIYALGVTLYQILTLRLPFSRKSLVDYRKNHRREELLDPEELAPYRDIPPRLSQIAKK